MSFLDSMLNIFKQEKPEPDSSFWLVLEESINPLIEQYPEGELLLEVAECARKSFWGRVETNTNSNGDLLMFMLSRFYLFKWLVQNDYLPPLLEKYEEGTDYDDYGDWDETGFRRDVSLFAAGRHIVAVYELRDIIPQEVLDYAKLIGEEDLLVFEDEFEPTPDFEDAIVEVVTSFYESLDDD